jgi:hypothetical protein
LESRWHLDQVAGTSPQSQAFQRRPAQSTHQLGAWMNSAAANGSHSNTSSSVCFDCRNRCLCVNELATRIVDENRARAHRFKELSRTAMKLLHSATISTPRRTTNSWPSSGAEPRSLQEFVRSLQIEFLIDKLAISTSTTALELPFGLWHHR